MAKVGFRSQAKLNTVDPKLRDVVTAALQAAPDWLDFGVISGRRTVAEQKELYSRGRTKPGTIVTHKDGVKKKSRHQPKKRGGPGEAIDIAAYKKGTMIWDQTATAAVASYVIGFAAAHGVELSGGVKWGWDYGHLELKKGS